MDVDVADSGAVILTLSNAELIALREAIAFADFSGDFHERSAAESEILGRFLRTVDPLIPELGSDDYDRALTRAWDEISRS